MKQAADILQSFKKDVSYAFSGGNIITKIPQSELNQAHYNFTKTNNATKGMDNTSKKASGVNSIDDIVGGAKNITAHENYKEVLKTTQDANPLVESLRETGKLPGNFVSKNAAIQNGWKPGKALENYVPGGQIGGDIFQFCLKVQEEYGVKRMWDF
ncbi:hypothetical protein [Bacillus pseudomycoides]|uniref:hypothetical protein n=1 Tax=Bacillus pseudomycoides TaxID=64104 RepID=UPI003D2317A2